MLELIEEGKSIKKWVYKEGFQNIDKFTLDDLASLIKIWVDISAANSTFDRRKILFDHDLPDFRNNITRRISWPVLSNYSKTKIRAYISKIHKHSTGGFIEALEQKLLVFLKEIVTNARKAHDKTITQAHIPNDYLSAIADSELNEQKKEKILEILNEEDKRKVAIHQEIEREKSKLYSRTLKLIQQVRPGIPITLQRLSDLLKLTTSEVESIIDELITIEPDLGEYLSLEQVFIKEKDLNDQDITSLSQSQFSRKDSFQICPNCSNSQSLLIRQCTNCKQGLDHCNICKQGFSSNDVIIDCTNCKNHFHKNHLLAYIQSQGQCPVCKEGMTLTQFE